MASLKDLRVRIKSVKSTQKITKAMQMVAASKLRRAREQAEAARPYAEKMQEMLGALAANAMQSGTASPLMVGRPENKTHLLVVATSDRGLCGGFNGSIVKAVKRRVDVLEHEGKTVKLLCVGKKGYEALKSVFGSKIAGRLPLMSGRTLAYEDAKQVAIKVVGMFEEGAFDSCSIVFSTFKSAISQIVTFKPLIPLQLPEQAVAQGASAVYEYEPEESEIQEALLPRNLEVQIFHSLLENAASEQGARMTAMDNATRNAGEMIKKLTLQYNRSRQAAITKELIEIISGAEAL